MPDYIIYNPTSSPVSNLVIDIIRSFDEGKEATLNINRIKNPNLSGVDISKPMRWNGSSIINLTQAELDSIATVRAQQNLTAIKQAAKNIFLTPTSAQNQAIALGFETILEMIVSEINILRAAVVPSLTARTGVQVKTSFRNTYENKVDSLT